MVYNNNSLTAIDPTNVIYSDYTSEAWERLIDGILHFQKSAPSLTHKQLVQDWTTLHVLTDDLLYQLRQSYRAPEHLRMVRLGIAPEFDPSYDLMHPRFKHWDEFFRSILPFDSFYSEELDGKSETEINLMRHKVHIELDALIEKLLGAERLVA